MTSDRYIIEPGTVADSDEILGILEETVFPSAMSLVYTRRPDAYRSFMAEGEDVHLFVCRDRRENRIAGMAAYALHDCFIDGRPQKVAYLLGLRTRPMYRGNRAFFLLPRAYQQTIEQLQGRGIFYFFTATLKDNAIARRFLTRQRPDMPRYHFLCPYLTLGFRTRRRPPSLPASCLFRKATPDDRPAIEDFLTREGRRYAFFPSDLDRLIRQHPELSWESFYLLLDRRCGDILACGATWDQSAYKQYIVTGYGGIMKWVRNLSVLFPFFGYPSLPRPSSTLHFFFLSFWAVKDNRPEHLKWFLDSLAYETRRYPYFVAGIPEPHPLRPVLDRRRLLRRDSHIYLVGNHMTSQDLERLCESPYFECGWL
jgi:hypothetical protein